jgi:uncharacterized membrane protein YbaN (DUF454 family)
VFRYVTDNPVNFAPRRALPAMLTRAARLAWLLVGVLSLSLGAIGIALPLLPTTPFILVAALAFARSSNTLHDWLITHNIFGPLIDNWQRYGAISRRAKAVSVTLAAPVSLIVLQLVVLGIAAFFILSRPSPPPG